MTVIMGKYRTATFLLALLMLSALCFPVYADEIDPDVAVRLDEAELTARIESYLQEKHISEENIGIGFYYTGTDEEFFYRGDEWFYSASLYKVPLTMAFAERESSGELTAESIVGGTTLERLERYLLINSNNEFAHAALRQLGDGDETRGREFYKEFAALDEEYYETRFAYASFFTPRYMTLCLKTLYEDPERFPRIEECMLQAEPEGYFRITLGEMYEIAQKYGAYEEWNSAAGIIYLPHPIIVTVMTRYVGNYSVTIGELGQLLADYALELDEALAAQQAIQEAERLAAEEALAAEAAAAAERAAQAAAAAAQYQVKPDTETPTADSGDTEADSGDTNADRERNTTLAPLAAVLAAAAAGEVIVCVTARKKKIKSGSL